MKKIVKKLDNETDWMVDYNVFAVNRDSRLFENTSWTKGMTIELYDNRDEDFDENRVSDALAKVFDDERGDYEYALYDDRHYLVGFVYR